MDDQMVEIVVMEMNIVEIVNVEIDVVGMGKALIEKQDV